MPLIPTSPKRVMPLRTLIKTKDEEGEHGKEKSVEMEEDEPNRHNTFPNIGIVSAIRKTISKYSISRPHSPVSSRPTSPGPINTSTSHLDEGLDKGEPSNAPSLVKNTSQIKQRPPLRPKPPSKEAKGGPRKDSTNNHHITFEVPPPPPELLPSQDLYALFSGAPVFSIVKNSNETPEPRVFFPFDDEDDEELEELSDCPPIAHPAFSLCTSRPHRPLNPDARGYRTRDDIDAEELGGLVEEEPSMLSFMGFEPGTCGWEYFMMYPVGDFAKAEDGDGDAIDEGGWERGRRGSMGNGKGGVRSVETDYIVERLKELGEIWNERKRKRGDEGTNIIINNIGDAGKPKGVLGKYSPLELYTQLFTRLLYPPTRITTEDFYDPYSLKVQVIALLETLAMKKFWLDFKDPYSRIRIGQILWRSRSIDRSDDSEDDGENDEEETASGRDAEKVWLLLQILLSCELAVRLDALSNDTAIETMESSGFVESKEDMCKRFKKIRTKKVEWDIVLARRWLDNVRIIDDEPITEKTTTHLAPPVSERRGWFSPRPSPPSPPPEKDEDGDSEGGTRSYEALIYPRNLTRQLSALVYFARCLQWPQIEALSLHLQEKIRSPSSFSTPAHSVSGTPLATPLSMTSTPTNSYFQTIGRPKRIQELVPPTTPSATTSSGLTRSSALMKTMGSGGWLSRTYFSGLILPGEGLPHFLISTLLENDAVAVDSLGDNSILYTGFQYEGSTWWSSNCIVGRVLAGYGGSKEVGGWIGPCLGIRLPTENGMVYKLAANGWLNVCSMLPEDEEPRVLNPRQVKEESNPLGTNYRESKGILSSDLSIPKDDIISGEKVLVERLVLLEPPREDDLDMEMDNATKYDAELHFQLGETEELAVKLRHDVFFITSFPCLEPHSGTRSSETDLQEQKKSGHPLHKEFRYSMLSIELLAREDERKDSGRVLVIEAGGEQRDREVLARAWCAERGVHAIVGARSRTCLSCCIREAKALGVEVVIRVG